MIRLKEAFERAKSLGLVRYKSDLARQIWKDSSPKSAYTNFTNLENGKTRKIDIDAVTLLCEKLNVSPEYLFGFTDTPTMDEYEGEVKEVAARIIELAQTL